MQIHVETLIRGSVDEVWRLTQTPDLHQRWDLRFTSITYLPRDEGGPQRFRYATRIGLGVEIEGWGETVGEQTEGGCRTSALRFGSDDPRSLIHAGSGYWKHEPVGDGVRFVTGYDYQVRCARSDRAALARRPAVGTPVPAPPAWNRPVASSMSRTALRRPCCHGARSAASRRAPHPFQRWARIGVGSSDRGSVGSGRVPTASCR